MLVDLVSPWCAAVEAVDPAHAMTVFRHRHAELLENLRRQRAPDSPVLQLPVESRVLRTVAARASDPSFQQFFREALSAAQLLGADQCERVILLPGDGTAPFAEPLPWPDGDAVLIIDENSTVAGLVVALAGALATITRWRTGTTAAGPADWDRWRAASDAPLREWIYTTGIGLRLAAALLPSLTPPEMLGVGRGTLERIRQRERACRELLQADLDRSGIGLVLRWLTPDAPARSRTIGTTTLHPAMGRYLAWRMVGPRVARVGIGESLRMGSALKS